jgi:hypothetical protein
MGSKSAVAATVRTTSRASTAICCEAPAAPAGIAFVGVAGIDAERRGRCEKYWRRTRRSDLVISMTDNISMHEPS